MKKYYIPVHITTTINVEVTGNTVEDAAADAEFDAYRSFCTMMAEGTLSPKDFAVEAQML